jgi:hypothetical protein
VPGDQNVNRRNHEVRSQCGGGPKHLSIPTHDSRRSIRHEVACNASDIGTDEGKFTSPRGCRGAFGSVGTAQATRIEANFTGTDCNPATFTGQLVLTKN